MPRLRLGVVGVGHLGKEHARILAALPEVELVGVADPNLAQAEAVAERCGTQAFADHRQLLPLVQAAVIAAPTAHHHSVARDFLNRGLALLIEKPLAFTVAQADELLALARLQGTLLQVGHIERFNPAFEEVQGLPLQPRYISAERCSGFSGRSTDIGVVLDLMIHDLDLVLTLVQSSVVSVQALGVAVLGGHEDMAQARLTFANGCLVDLCSSRVHPTGVRRMNVWGSEGYAGLDLATRHLTLIQPGELLRHGRLDSRRLDTNMLASLKNNLYGGYLQMEERNCNTSDQLTRELQDFVQCLRTDRAPRVDGVAGRDALAVAWQILDAVRSHAWQGQEGSPAGPWQLPAAHGLLFSPVRREAA
jgi:predicted dehydrogenase